MIDADATRCGECNTDLSLFDVEGDDILDDEAPGASGGKSLDDILDSIVSGKDVRPDIFDDIKTIATTRSVPDDDILADTEVEPGAEFECPNCGTAVASSARACPGCGAEFAEEAVEQFECPLCNAVVDVNATSCPNCGVAFAEEEERPAPPPSVSRKPPTKPPTRLPLAVVEEAEFAAPRVTSAPRRPERGPPARPSGPSPSDRLRSLVESRRMQPMPPLGDKGTLYKELPRLVNEVKPLLLTAKKVGVDIGNEKELIGEAIGYGKKRDVEKAVQLIRQARSALENAFTSQIAKRVEDVLAEAERARTGGADVTAIQMLCSSAIDALESRDYAVAGEAVRSAKEEFEARSGGYAKARQEIAAVKALVADAKRLGLNLREVDTYFQRVGAAMNAKSYDQAAGLAVQARQALFKALPDVLHKEMKKARNALLDMKVQGGDLTKPVGLLKQASIHMKREEFADAVKFVRLFQDEVDNDRARRR